MLSQYIPKRYATALLKHIIAVSLFFPYFYSHNMNMFYQDFILSNFFAVLSILVILFSWKLDLSKNVILLFGLGLLLIAYNVFATYMNYNYHHWYGEQINTTISFLLFIILLMVRDTHAILDTSTIKATIHMIVTSNVLAIAFHLFTKSNKLFFINDRIDIVMFSEDFLVNQFSWLYGHKSQYGMILLLCTSFLTINRTYFRNIFTYIISQGILIFCIYLSDSYTSLIGVFIILTGLCLDYICSLKFKQKLLVFLLAIPSFYFIILKFYHYIKQNRNILTIGSRTNIWSTFLEIIKNNPNGILTSSFGEDSFLYYVKTDYKMWTNNAHNIFLNHILRYSMPVGFIFAALFILLFLFSIKYRFKFVTICIWIAIFISINMDYSLTSVELTFVLLLIFQMFFTEKKR